MTEQRLRVEIHGAVQGVGFRPYVYRLAVAMGLRGWVINDTQGVFIEVEGNRSTLEDFLARLSADKPPRARIDSLDAVWLAPVGYGDFEIRHSQEQGVKTVLVLPDIATCADCLAEVADPADRRYRYPFTNCTNCGPRFTIIQALPYDRPHTTMAHFAMCPQCRAEYENPLDRRFHAQPIACPACGPQLALYGAPAGAVFRDVSGGRPGTTARESGRWPRSAGGWHLMAEGEGALRSAADALKAGAIVAVKGLGGFHLMVDAGNPQAVARLRERKPRRDKPFALMARDLDQARTLCRVSPQAAEALTGPEAPILLLPRRAGAPVADNVAPDSPNLGVMLPYTPLHHLLLQELDFPVVATSGNLTDEPICTDEWEAMERLGHVAGCFLIHDRPIARHVDDSVAWILDGEVRLLRRARGYAPLPVRMARPLPTLLGVGAHLKNTVALSVGEQVFISQHIGDLETAEALAAFERVIADFLRLYEARPVAIAHDLHPDYLSTRWAQQQLEQSGPGAGLTLIPVQHHHAHLAACLAENQAEGSALGVTWDGTGYGPDGTVWGGEFLLGDATGFTRVAHLRPFRLPGGEAAIQEPRRVALALLWELDGERALLREDLAPVQALSPTERRVLAQMLDRGIHAPWTTSAGRLFDGVAALLGLHPRVTFEGQAAMALEFVADPDVRDAYPVALVAQPCGDPSANHAPWVGVWDWAPLVEALLDDLARGTEVGVMAARFHNAAAAAILAVAQAVGEPRVALTGGCFQNRLLTERAVAQLRQAGFQVLLHRQVPPNDGGISLGQVAVAAARWAGGG